MKKFFAGLEGSPKLKSKRRDIPMSFSKSRTSITIKGDARDFNSTSLNIQKSLNPKHYINHKKFQIFDVNDKEKVLQKLKLIKSVDTKMEFLDFVAYVREEKKEELEFQKIRENERLLRKFVKNVRQSIQQRKLNQFNAHFTSGIKVFAELLKDKDKDKKPTTVSYTNLSDVNKKGGLFTGAAAKKDKNKQFLVRKFANILKQSRSDSIRS